MVVAVRFCVRCRGIRSVIDSRMVLFVSRHSYVESVLFCQTFFQERGKQCYRGEDTDQMGELIDSLCVTV